MNGNNINFDDKTIKKSDFYKKIKNLTLMILILVKY